MSVLGGASEINDVAISVRGFWVQRIRPSVRPAAALPSWVVAATQRRHRNTQKSVCSSSARLVGWLVVWGGTSSMRADMNTRTTLVCACKVDVRVSVALSAQNLRQWLQASCIRGFEILRDSPLEMRSGAGRHPPPDQRASSHLSTCFVLSWPLIGPKTMDTSGEIQAVASTQTKKITAHARQPESMY